MHLRMKGTSIILLLCCASTVFAKIDLLSKAIHAGMSKEQVRQVLPKFNYFYRDHSYAQCSKPPLSWDQIGPMSYLICTYGKAPDGNIKDQDIVTKVEIAHFTDIGTPVANMQIEVRGLVTPVSKTLWECIRLIHQSPEMNPIGFDPVALIKTVNGLRKHGKTTAIQALKLYRDLAMRYEGQDQWLYNLEQERIYNICYLLFYPAKSGVIMPRHPGPSSKEVEANRDAWPMFPLVVVDGIPFYLAQCGFRSGPPSDPLKLIEFCDQNCSLREYPLLPRTSPLVAVENLYDSALWRKVFLKTSPSSFSPFDDGNRNVQFVREQAIRCLRLPEYRIGSFQESFDYKICPNCVGAHDADKFWQEYTIPLHSMPILWDESKEEFITGESLKSK